MGAASFIPIYLTAIFVASCIASIIPQQRLGSPPAELPAPLPLVIWHGLGDNYLADGLRTVGTLANATNPGTYTYYIHLADDAGGDRSATFFGNLTEQVAQVCADLASHPVLSKAPAMNAIGFSQGGQFMRAYVERCNNPPVANLVTFGSQHTGISEFQSCKGGDWLCQGAENLLRGNTWSTFVQSRLVPAQYFRDAGDLEPYLEHSNFLADVNNERERKNQTYKENLMRLERFVMFLFEDDQTVIPKQSGWFGEVNMTSGDVTMLEDTRLYKEDWLGLKALDQAGRLELRVTDGGHMALSEELLIKVFKKYFRPQVA